MKKFSVLFLATSLVFATNLNASQEPPELQEAAKLTVSVVRLFQDGKYDDALKLAKRALEIREKLLPRSDPRVALSLGYVGDLYFLKADYKDAREAFQRLLQINEERFGPEDPIVANTLDRIGDTYFQERKTDEAEAAYQRALAVREKSYGASSPQVGRSMYQLGEVYRAKRDFERGAASYRRALMIFGPLTGVDTREFERTSDRFMCLAWEHKKSETLREIERLRQQFLSPDKFFDPYDILNGRAVSLPKPAWPPIRVERGFSATVSIKVDIDETGKVVGVADMCDAPLILSTIAAAAARKARFTPTIVQGRPIKVKGIIQYHFIREW